MRDHVDPVVAGWAAAAEAEYQYPVDSQVWSSDGKLLDHLAANAGNGVSEYHALLDAARCSTRSGGGR